MSSNTATSLDIPKALESLSNSHSWDIDEPTREQLKQIYSLNVPEFKQYISKYIGEKYGHEMVCDILGYIPILASEDKHDSFPQGLDGIYLDSEEAIVVTEFKGQNSGLSDLQKMDNYASYVCQKIVEGKDSPYKNSPQWEKEFARQILEEIENGANVRYEVYRTKFDTESGNLSTSLKKRCFSELVNLSSQRSEVKDITSKPGVLDKIIERNKEYQENIEEIIELLTISQNGILMAYERQEAAEEFSNKLKIFAQKVYSSGTLSRIEKARITRALNGLEPKPKPKPSEIFNKT